MAKTRTDTEAVVKLVINGEQAKTSVKELTDAVRKYESELKNMKKADDPRAYLEKAKNVRVLKGALEEARREVNGVSDASKKLALSWKDIAKGIIAGGGIMAGVAMLRDLGRQIISTYTEFEKYRAVLENSLGSQAAANRAMAELQDFAKSTPFQLNELTESYVKLVNRGMQPSMEEMRKMGDLASSQGKSFDQLTEAILDATTGEFERLKDLGLRGSKSGDMISLSFKGVTKEVKNSADAIKEAIVSFGEMEGVAGTTEKMAQTLGGQISNMSDNWGQLLTTLGSQTGSWLSLSVGKINEYLEFLTNAIKSTEQRINESIDTRVGRNVASFAKKTLQEQNELIEGTKLIIKDYEIATQELYTIGKSEQAEKQQQLVETEKRTLQAYIEYQEKQVEIKKKAEEEKNRLAAAARREEAEKLRKEAERKARQQEAALKKEHDNLKKMAKEMEADFNLDGLDGLDKKLAEIDRKYQPLIDKAKKFKDEALVGLFKGLQAGEKTRANESSWKEEADDDEKNRKEAFAKAKDELESQFAKRGVGIVNDSLNEEDLATKEYDLESERLIALKLLYEAYGEDSVEFERSIADRKLAERQRLKDGQDELAAAELATDQALMDGMEAGAMILKGIVDQTGGMYKAMLVAEKAIAIARVILNTQTEISGYYAKYALVPGGEIIATGLAAKARIRSGISIGIIGAQGIAELATSGQGNKKKKYASGGLLPSGPSHAQGGISLVDNITGAVMGEIEGGEPILSRDTYRNNRKTIDALLYSSQRKNGANISLDGGRIATGERMYRNGGVIERRSSGSKPVAPVVNVDMQRLEALMAEMIAAQRQANDKKVYLPYKDLEDTTSEVARIRTSLDA